MAYTTRPWLLYSFPWMPFPRRIQLYLREKRIPTSLVTIIHVSDPQKGNAVVLAQADKYPPRPEGSLPILAIPPQTSSVGVSDVVRKDNQGGWTYIRQSIAIINFLEEATSSTSSTDPLTISHPSIRSLIVGQTPLERARLTELLTLAEELTILWNPVRTFGSGAGTMNIPEATREMFRWVSRTLAAVNGYLAGRYLDVLRSDDNPVSLADVVLYQFLEFTDYCYGLDLTVGTGNEVTDVYGRDVKETYENLRAFYKAFKVRKSAVRDEGLGELASEDTLKAMRTWHEGVW